MRKAIDILLSSTCDFADRTLYVRVTRAEASLCSRMGGSVPIPETISRRVRDQGRQRFSCDEEAAAGGVAGVVPHCKTRASEEILNLVGLKEAQFVTLDEVFGTLRRPDQRGQGSQRSSTCVRSQLFSARLLRRGRPHRPGSPFSSPTSLS